MLLSHPYRVTRIDPYTHVISYIYTCFIWFIFCTSIFWIKYQLVALQRWRVAFVLKGCHHVIDHSNLWIHGFHELFKLRDHLIQGPQRICITDHLNTPHMWKFNSENQFNECDAWLSNFRSGIKKNTLIEHYFNHLLSQDFCIWLAVTIPIHQLGPFGSMLTDFVLNGSGWERSVTPAEYKETSSDLYTNYMVCMLLNICFYIYM